MHDVTPKLFGRRLTAVLLPLALACALAFAGGAGRSAASGEGGAAGANTTATREGRLRVFDEVWEQVGARYFDPSMQGVDWEGAKRELRPRAAEAGGEAEFYAVLRRMLGLLRDPHTRVFAPGESADWRVQRYVSVGLSVRELGGEVVVTNVERDSGARRAGVRAGDSVLSVDGAPAPALLARRLAEHGAGSTRAARLAAVTRLFDGPPDTEVEVAFRRAGETRVRSARLRREQRTRLPSFEVRRAPGGVRVARFNIFTHEVAALFARAMRDEMKGARALVLDLRDNGGGESEAMADIASTLVEPGVGLGRFTDREGRVRLEPSTRAALLSTAGVVARFGGPLIVLTNARTASAAEVFAASLRESGRAAVVGEATCGCVLGIRRRHLLPDGGVLDISEMDYHTARGSRLEGRGVSPDVEVTPTREDLRSGRDRALERATDILKNRKPAR